LLVRAQDVGQAVPLFALVLHLVPHRAKLETQRRIVAIEMVDPPLLAAIAQSV